MNWLFERGDSHTPGLALRLRLRPEVVIEQLPSGGVDVIHLWGAIRLNGISAAVAATLKHLNSDWVEKTQLCSMAAASGSENAPEINIRSLSEHIWILDRLGFLCRVQLILYERPLVTIEPVSCASKLVFGTEGGRCLRLSRFAYLRPHENGLALESAVATYRVVLHDYWGVALTSALARGGEPAALAVAVPELGAEAVLTLVALLDAAGMLEGREHASAAGTGAELLEMGEFHDLLFHRCSRFGLYDAPFGARFPYLGKVPSPSPLPAPLAASSVALPTPSEEEVRARDLTLTQALERRASVRRYADEPLSLSQLGEFLFRSARVRAQYGPLPDAGMPYQATDRPYPSGGAIHDLELYLIVSEVQNLPAGAYHYAADRHALEPLPSSEEDITLLLRAAMRSSATSKPPQVLIKITSRFGRMCWKYRSISYATTLKNVGVLYQTMYLVATAMRLAPCALGAGDDVAARRAFDLTSRSEIVVGEFMLGNPPSTAEPVPDVRPGLVDATWLPRIAPNWGRA
jgi:SagB-type dehydrogenase family enzyme